MAQVAREVLNRLDIVIPERKLGGPVKMLSGGQRQGIAIGRAIYWNALVLIMDEPTAALGVPEQRKVMELIRALKAQSISVLLISHNLHDIFAIADRIVVLRRGEVAGKRQVANQWR
ncbi:MAG: ABC transporter, ATP-binding protein (cluster 2, ribose/xylose/arabinose/galactose) [uncultured Caballeronia sp.]|nr:MAG: ABC transporter, ATP-binding protein (cluster 2, ribose/xylose/arabinose/galactose) [uncultured Caballeronia sp.]